MVGYGGSLSRARRPGWEDTYLDYDSLNKLLKEIDHLCGTRGRALSARLGFDVHDIQGSTGSDSNDGNVFKEIDEDIQDLFHRFLTKLQTETEKVSLFVLSKQGQLADAVGALRFGEAAGQIANPTTSVGGSSNDETSMDVNLERSGSSDEEDDDDDAVDFGRFGEEAALLPYLPRKSGSRSRSKDSLSTPKPIFGGTNNNSMLSDWKGDNKMDSYTVLGVELLHILRYICVNAMGIRKILKKHNKLLAKYSAQFAYSAEFRDRSDWDKSLVQSQSSDYRLAGGADGHLQQLANSNSMAAVHASLISALAGFEQAAIRLQSGSDAASEAAPKFLREHRRTKTNPHISIQKADEIEIADMMEEGSPPSSLTRLQCTLWSINTLREYAQVANQPYEAFLSRKAMIVTGDSIGGLKGTTKQALEVLLHFQPDSILYMDDSTLENWQKQSAYRGGRESIGGEEEEETVAWGGINSSSMIINLMSILLYTVSFCFLLFGLFLCLPLHISFISHPFSLLATVRSGELLYCCPNSESLCRGSWFRWGIWRDTDRCFIVGSVVFCFSVFLLVHIWFLSFRAIVFSSLSFRREPDVRSRNFLRFPETGHLGKTSGRLWFCRGGEPSSH
jgi:hypothetical protein